MIPPEYNSVLFYSRFESGNLLKAIKVEVPKNEHQEYDLYLQKDYNTDGHMHWFYFKIFVSDLNRGTRIRLNIRNLVRGKSLF